MCQFFPVGSTVRLIHAPKGPIGVLLVSKTVASQFWLNILPHANSQRLRHYILEEDFFRISHRVHVRPEVSPCFLIIDDGYVVDWFPAPLPPTGYLEDIKSLLSLVEGRLMTYEEHPEEEC